MARVNILAYQDSSLLEKEDQVAEEEPLEILLEWRSGDKQHRQNLAVTMRTPGRDEDLVRGFLLSEGIIRQDEDIRDIEHLRDHKHLADENRICVRLRNGLDLDPTRWQRNFYTSSSCGVCGKASIEAIRTLHWPEYAPNHPVIPASLICRLPGLLHTRQNIFASTGGLHATGLFNSEGECLVLREDVGRHNAMDKSIGFALHHGIPMRECIAVVSGRASFELVQKAIMAGIPCLVAIGAPSSLAVELAIEAGMTLTGFTKSERFNIYSGSERILPRVTLE